MNRSTRKFALILLLLCVSAQAAEEIAEGEELTRTQRCYACHARQDALIGPPWAAIAARHGNADRELVVKVLATKIRQGGGGNWGVVPMVPNEHVSEKDAETLVRWILGLNDGA